jgi:hypothetical protein
MTIDELKQVVAKIQLGDNRQVDRLVILEWFDTIGDLNVSDALEAVRLHRRESTDYLVPAHIVRLAYRVKDQRAVDRGPVFCPEHDGYPDPCHACAEVTC